MLLLVISIIFLYDKKLCDCCTWLCDSRLRSIYITHYLILFFSFFFFFFLNMFIDADHTQDLRPTRCVQKNRILLRTYRLNKLNYTKTGNWNIPINRRTRKNLRRHIIQTIVKQVHFLWDLWFKIKFKFNFEKCSN